MEETFNDFSKRMRNQDKRVRKHKPIQYRLKNVYAREKESGWVNVGKRIPYSVFCNVYKQFGKIMAEHLLQGQTIILPFLGSLTPTKQKSVLRRCNLNATLKLWFEDDEAKANKQKVYHTTLDKTKIVFSGIKSLPYHNIITFVPTNEFAERLFRNRHELGITNNKSLLV